MKISFRIGRKWANFTNDSTISNKINANLTICRYIEIWCPVPKILHHSTADSSRLATLLALLALSLSKRLVEVPSLADLTQVAWNVMNKRVWARV